MVSSCVFEDQTFALNVCSLRKLNNNKVKLQNIELLQSLKSKTKSIWLNNKKKREWALGYLWMTLRQDKCRVPHKKVHAFQENGIHF